MLMSLNRSLGRAMILLLVILSFSLGSVGAAPLAVKRLAASNAQLSRDAQRQRLWESLVKAWPKTQGAFSADLYAENPLLTKVCFRHGRDWHLYTLGDTHFQAETIAKALPPINCVTFETSRKPFSTGFVLWSDGKRELLFDLAP